MITENLLWKPVEIPERTTEELIHINNVNEEYLYVYDNYKKYDIIYQTVFYDSIIQKDIDVIVINNSSGETKYLYFDIATFMHKGIKKLLTNKIYKNDIK